MAVEIVMPRVDMDMATGRMGRWHAPEGAHVVKGAILFEIETDKAAMEVDSPASGVLRHVAACEGDILPVGACIGWIVAEGEDFVPPSHAPASASPAPSVAAGGGAEANDSAYANAALGRRATPAARRIARERGLRLSAVRGSGPNGRIQKRDIEEVAPVADRLGRAPKGARKDAPLSTAHGARRHAVNREWLTRGERAPIVFLHGLCADL